MRPIAILCAAALLAATAAPARAMFITPGPTASSIPMSTNLTTGTPVEPGGLVGQAYTSFGLNFASAALGDINGTTVWLPVDTPNGPVEGQLNFTPGYGGAVQVLFVLPGTTTPTTVDYLRVEMTGVAPSGPLVGAGAIIASDGNGNGFVNIKPTLLPNGNVELILDRPGLVGFNAYKQLTLETEPGPWGVVSIQTSSIQDTPEPGTLALATLGAGVLAWRRLRRRGA